jgi:hypothetical protein
VVRLQKGKQGRLEKRVWDADTRQSLLKDLGDGFFGCQRLNDML